MPTHPQTHTALGPVVARLPLQDLMRELVDLDVLVLHHPMHIRKDYSCLRCGGGPEDVYGVRRRCVWGVCGMCEVCVWRVCQSSNL